MSGFRLVLMGLLAVALTGCVTQGLRDSDAIIAHYNCNTATAQIGEAQTCLLEISQKYYKIALDYTDEGVFWNYGMTLAGASVVGVGVFNAGEDALKGTALGLGTSSALNSVRAPSTMASLYLGGAKAVSCMYYAALEVPSGVTRAKIDEALGQLDKNLNEARGFAGTPAAAADVNLPLLNAAITAAVSAEQVAANALSIVDAPGTFLMSQQKLADLQILAKLTARAAPLDVNALVSSIQTQVNNATTKKAAAAGADAVLPKSLVRANAPTALDISYTLKQNIKDVLADAQGLADMKANVPVCLTSIPS